MPQRRQVVRTEHSNSGVNRQPYARGTSGKIPSITLIGQGGNGHNFTGFDAGTWQPSHTWISPSAENLADIENYSADEPFPIIVLKRSCNFLVWVVLQSEVHSYDYWSGFGAPGVTSEVWGWPRGSARLNGFDEDWLDENGVEAGWAPGEDSYGHRARRSFPFVWDPDDPGAGLLSSIGGGMNVVSGNAYIPDGDGNVYVYPVPRINWWAKEHLTVKHHVQWMVTISLWL